MDIVNSDLEPSIRNRKLNFDACYNARDLGGIETSDGQQICWGAFVRADNLFRLTPEGRASLLAHGIRTIIDLRMLNELEKEPNPLANAEEVIYNHISLVNPQHSGVLERAVVTEGMLAWNLNVLELGGADIVEAMRAIANAPEGGVLFHCFAGKDRTGLIAMFLLSLAGVSPTRIAEDYHESNQYLSAFNEDYVARFSDPLVQQRVRDNLNSGFDNMMLIQTHIQEKYGGPEAYLLKHGLTEAEIEAIRQRLL